MKKFRLMFILASMIAAVAACSGGDDDDDDDGVGDDDDDGGSQLSSGTYTVSGFDLASDDCGLGIMSFDGAEFDVTVTASTVSIDVGEGSLDLDVNGSSLSSSTSGPAQLAKDCTVDATVDDNGSITGTNEFDLTESISLENPVGADCAGTGIPFPCTSEYSFTLSM